MNEKHNCPTCHGSGTNAHELPSHERFVHGSELHECYRCEGTGYMEQEAASTAPTAAVDKGTPTNE